ncbi:GNAT family N-acetyltransferase [Bizionia arctica]|uniref:N-acetyltransferase n=1 Tax=Bizionia arctica TaxID=1495645 RepID=A0A917GHN3_9FLAO|nr:GNAT family N-acetyltransferase [Bizionia arctica]GGG45996.1 N-acetyltransferase [Bizionia arctica]
MKPQTLQIASLITDRLILIPFTIQICDNLLKADFSDLDKLNLIKGKSWPDQDVLETLPRIITNLSQEGLPTGFESWMLVKKETSEVIGDLGFKGFNSKENNADLGYGIIKEERQKGYALEATKKLIFWAFSNKILREITAKCLVENQSSINLLQKLNFKEVQKDNDMIYWSLLKPIK